MTQPDKPRLDAAAQIGGGILIETDGNGRYFPALQLTVGGNLVAYKIRMDPASAPEFLANLAQGMAEASAKCRQLNTGLVTAEDLARMGGGQQPTPGMPRMNGRQGRPAGPGQVGPLGLPRG